MMGFDGVSVIIIGRNEEENLELCIRSVQESDTGEYRKEIIYVDSASMDRSVIIAESLGVKVMEIESVWLTPGLGRNVGLINAKYDLVHFLDGDTELDRNYLSKAIERLTNGDVSAVYGFLQERSGDGVNRMLLNHWDERQEGLHDYTGGGGTYVRERLVAINGYDERIRKGQEVEMGERFRLEGNRIWFINERMGIHDYGIRSFRDLIRVLRIDGLSKSHTWYVRGSTQFFRDNNRKAWNNIIFCLGSVIAFFLSLLLWGFTGVVLVVLIFIGYFILINSKAIRDLNWIKFSYNLIWYLGRFITAYGQVLFFIRLWNKDFRKNIIKEKNIL